MNRNSEEQDIVDKVFNLGHKVINTGYRISDELANAALNTVKSIGTNAKSNDVVTNMSVKGRGGVHNWLPGLPTVFSNNWMLGVGCTLIGSALLWKTGSLLTIPSHVPKAETQCILVLGDMSDPIVRSQVMDLYRRRFTVFVCSESSRRFKGHENETDYLYYIDPSSQDDLYQFTSYLSSKGSDKRKLASILFMPNLAYHKPGDVSLTTLQYELRSNILINYNTLLKLIPLIPQEHIQLILFNPSLSYNLERAHHSTELFVSGFITSIYRSLKSYNTLDVAMVHLGLFQVRGQLSNYKYLRLKGSDINQSLHKPIYRIIMNYNGNFLQQFAQFLYTFGSTRPIYYLGNYSFLATFSAFSNFIILKERYSHILVWFQKLVSAIL